MEHKLATAVDSPITVMVTSEYRLVTFILMKKLERKGYVLGYVDGAKEMQKENEELKRQVSYIEDNLRVVIKDIEDLRDSVANRLKEFIKERPGTSLSLLANKEIKEENEQLKAQIEKMKCCGNCKLRGAECVALEYQGILCGKTRDKWELAE